MASDKMQRMSRKSGILAAILVLVPALRAAEPLSPALPPEPSAPVSVSADYIIGPGDVLQVFVLDNPELTITVPVLPDGKISTPLVQDMIAVGKTSSMLASDIEKVLSEYVRSPQVSVIITQAASAFSQVKVMGRVQRQQPLPYREGMVTSSITCH